MTIDAPEIYFSGLELKDDVKDSVYPKLCVEAQSEIKAQLMRRLPAQIKPLGFDVSPENKKANADKTVLQMIITKCEVDVQQWNGSFTFYLTLNLQLSLKDSRQSLMSYNMKTYEQLQTAAPDPSFEFTFEEPVARTLILFDNGRVWIPNEN